MAAQQKNANTQQNHRLKYPHLHNSRAQLQGQKKQVNTQAREQKHTQNNTSAEIGYPHLH